MRFIYSHMLCVVIRAKTRIFSRYFLRTLQALRYVLPASKALASKGLRSLLYSTLARL
jgi:hypothetical protein